MPTSKKHEEMDALFDETLLEILKGRVVLDEDGHPVLDASGKPVLIRPSAADLRVIQSRLKDLGISKGAIPSAGPAAQLIAEAQRRGLKLAPVSTDMDLENDDAATRESA